MEYEFVWRNKWLTSDADSIDDMITSLRSAADELQAMQSKGVWLADDGAVGDDNASLRTDDPQVAKEFGFDPAADEE